MPEPMTTAEALHKSADSLEETLRQIDAGEIEATAIYRAWIVGCIRGLRKA